MSRASSALRVASCAALVAALGSCGGQGDAPTAESPEGPIAYGQHTDGRGWAVHEEGLFGHRRVLDLPNSPESAPRGQNLGVLGYAQGSENAPATTGVLVRQTARMAPGLNLMNSGDAAEAVLMDSEGTVKHAWRLPYDDIPDAPPLATSFQIPWRRVHMRPDGSLLAMHSDAALVYVDRKSKLRWTLFDRVHHDLDVLEGPDGPTIFALARRERSVPEVNPDQPVIDDLIIRVNARGEKTLTVSLWDAFTSSEWAPMLERLNEREDDVMHANSLEILDEHEAALFKNPAVRAGNALVCMRNLDLVAVIDLEASKMVWVTPGPDRPHWRGAHDPTLTDRGEILIFDNLGGVGGNSRLVALEPGARSANWTWAGDPAESFSSMFCGTLDALPGGNILATESCHGRAIEIDRASGEIVWEFVSERVAGDDEEFVAALFEVQRIPRPDWLASSSK